MADLSDLPPEVAYALRTGLMPPHLVDFDPASDDPYERSPEAREFRERYRAMVAARIEDWIIENPARSMPRAARERIEQHCDKHIRGQWRIFTQNHPSRGAPAEEPDDQWRNPW